MIPESETNKEKKACHDSKRILKASFEDRYGLTWKWFQVDFNLAMMNMVQTRHNTSVRKKTKVRHKVKICLLDDMLGILKLKEIRDTNIY
jgi:hypothetical protein